MGSPMPKELFSSHKASEPYHAFKKYHRLPHMEHKLENKTPHTLPLILGHHKRKFCALLG
jgi:hypothetical protein